MGKDLKATSSSTDNKRRRAAVFLIKAGVLLCIFIVVVALYRIFEVGIPCPIYHFTGLYCPGCGMMRAINSMLSLNFYQAFRYNAMSVLLLPTGILLFILRFAAILRKKDKSPHKWVKYLALALTVLCVLFTLLRNIPSFEYFQPTIVST